MTFNEYDWNRDYLVDRIYDAQRRAKDAGNYTTQAELGVIAEALEAIDERGMTDAFMQAVNDYNELTDAVAVYLIRTERTNRRARDLVLETLVNAARERFNDMEAFINDARYYLTDEGRNALKDALALNYNATEGSAVKC